jgi:hypothetical protein
MPWRCAGAPRRLRDEEKDTALISTPADLPRTTPTPAAGRTEILSAASIAVMAAAVLVYVSGSFLIAEALGIKRGMQAVLAIPIVLMASYYVAMRTRRLLDPLIGFVVLKTVAELAFRGTALDIFDDVATLFGLTVIRASSSRAALQGVRLVTVLAGVLAIMAVVQWIVLFFEPDLLDDLLTTDEEGKVVGTVHHVIALLGLATGEQYTLFGHTVSRLQSFAKEPSLNLVFFLIPSAIAFLRGGTAGMFWGATMLGFCMLSLSGSVLLSLAFSGGAWLALRVFSVKTVLAWGTLSVLGIYLAAVRSGSLNSVLSFITFMSDYGNFMSKEKSFTYRAGGAANSLAGVASAPLGSNALSELPGPWMVNGALAAGWLGAFMLVLFVRKLAIELNTLNVHHGRALNVRVGTLVLIGAMATVIIFNDYQMSNYPGLILLAIAYRLIEALNERDRDADGAPVARPQAPYPRPSEGTPEHAANPL